MNERSESAVSVMNDSICLLVTTSGARAFLPKGGMGIWDWKRGVAVSVRPNQSLLPAELSSVEIGVMVLQALRNTSSVRISSIGFVDSDRFLISAFNLERGEGSLKIYVRGINLHLVFQRSLSDAHLLSAQAFDSQHTPHAL